MLPAEPTLAVLLLAAVAAAASGLGALPLLGRKRLPPRWLGSANALAGGMMFGVAYALTVGLAAGVPFGAGAVLGVLFIAWTHAASGTAEMELNRVGDEDPTYAYRVLWVNALHAAVEGVAIGVAMAVDLSLGVFMALAIAAHNVPESTALCAVLRSRGARLSEAAGLAVVTDVPQVLLAVVAYAVATAAPGALPWLRGFAMGALVNLVLVELLPESYRQAGRTSIAVVAAVAMGIVVLLQGVLL